MQLGDLEELKREVLWGNVFLSDNETAALIDAIDNQPTIAPETLPIVTQLQTELNLYKHYFGEIIFPEDTVARHNAYSQPADWMYSFNGLSWRQLPMDTGKIELNKAMLRRKPTNCIIGVTNDVKQHPNQYEYSQNNGESWNDLCPCDNPSGHTWIYHGKHDTTWFRKR